MYPNDLRVGRGGGGGGGGGVGGVRKKWGGGCVLVF